MHKNHNSRFSSSTKTETNTNLKPNTDSRKKRFMLAKELVAFTPKQMKAKYDAYGVTWKMRDFYLTYFVAVSAGFLFSWMFDLNLLYGAITVIICSLVAPFFIMSQKKFEYEAGRFADINIYMQQMSQAMIQKSRIITALQTVAEVFPPGEMKDTLEQAIYAMATSENVREGEIKGFAIIQKKYPNKPLKTLHDFSMRLEDRGGDYSNELTLLDKTRAQWRERIENYQKDLATTMFTCSIEYGIIMGVCAFIQNAMPENMSTSHLAVVQIAEVLAILVFALFVMSLQKKRCKHWLSADENMTEKEANEALDYLEKFDPQEKRRLSVRLGVLWGCAGIIIAILTKSILFFMMAVIVEIILLNMHYIVRWFIRRQVREALKSAFPVWLFDICLLIQKENVTVSITKSIPEAPHIMKRELERLVEALHAEPTNAELFFKFLSEYDIPGVKDAMCMMVSLNNGTGGDKKVQMEQLVKANTQMIDKEDRINAKMKEAALARYYYYPLLPCMGLMGCYFFTIIVKIMQDIMETISVAF